MVNENAAQRERATIVNLINHLKPTAIRLGYDYPTVDETSDFYTNEDLIEFHKELADFITQEAEELNNMVKENN